MKISIITVVFNDLKGLKKTVASVLEQTSDDYEYIILDGGSTDGCIEYIKSLKFRGKYKSEPDSGIYNAMNKAVKMAEGDYCLFMNAGDTFYNSQIIEKAAGAMTDADIYVGHTIEIGENILESKAPFPMTIQHLLKTSIYHQSTFTKRELLLKHPYNENHKIVSDWEFFFERWLNNCSYEVLDFFVSYYYLGGYSFVHQDIIKTEREEVINRLIPLRLRMALTEQHEEKEKTQLEIKIDKAMKMSPVQRDLKILRNAFKALLKDLF